MTYIPLKVRTKLALKKIMPTFIFTLILKAWRATFSKLSSGKDMNIIAIYTKKFLDETGYNVVGGPFKGLKYVKEAAGSSYLVKLIGVYEEILHETVISSIKREYTTMIDIGCAEGYYLIGIGKASKETTLIGYDIDKKALALTQELYDINDLSNKLILLDDCSPKDLNSRIDTKTLLICDAEGFENDILDPALVPALLNVQTFIVELHDFVVPHIKEILTKRFEKTHTIQTIVFKNGNPESYPFLMNIQNKNDLYTILRERGEQEQEWLVIEKR
jgi:hypothetical protein